MGYHAEFKRARNINGKFYRDQGTGDLVEYCPHVFVIKPIFTNETEYHAEIIEEDCRRFEQFDAVCILCGLYTFIGKGHVLTPDEWEKEIERRVKEIEDNDKEPNHD